MCQQFVKDLPKGFLGVDSSDDEDERWIGFKSLISGLDEEAVQMDIGEAIVSNRSSLGGLLDNDENGMSDDFDSPHIEDNSLYSSSGEPDAPIMRAENQDWSDFSKLSVE